MSSVERYSDFLTWSAPLPRRHAMPCEVVDLSDQPEFVAYLLRDGCGAAPLPSDPRLHDPNAAAAAALSAASEGSVAVDWAAARREFRDDTVMERGAAWDDEHVKVFGGAEAVQSAAAEQQAHRSKVPAFTAVVDRVVAAMQRLAARRLPSMDGVVVVGAYGTADDAGWATSTNTPACVDLVDVFTTLTTSTKFTRDLQRQVDNKNKDSASSGTAAGRVYFVLRPFLDINPSTEFRVFVEHGTVVGICQRCMDQMFPHLFPFAVPLSSSSSSWKQAQGDDSGAGGESAAPDFVNADPDLALWWAHQIEQCVMKHVVEPVIAAAASSTKDGDDEEDREWAEAPSLIVDCISRPPSAIDAMDPVVVLGVQAVAPDLNAASGTAAASAELFRVFGNAEALREWQCAVIDFLAVFAQRRAASSDADADVDESGGAEAAPVRITQAQIPSTVIRIATESDDLIRDARAAHRGAAPLELTDPAAFQLAVEQMKAVAGTANGAAAIAGNAMESIMKARAAVHGAHDMSKN